MQVHWFYTEFRKQVFFSADRIYSDTCSACPQHPGPSCQVLQRGRWYLSGQLWHLMLSHYIHDVRIRVMVDPTQIIIHRSNLQKLFFCGFFLPAFQNKTLSLKFWFWSLVVVCTCWWKHTLRRLVTLRCLSLSLRIRVFHWRTTQI